MAIINSYPKGTPKAEDLLIGTDVPQEYSGKEGITKNFKITDIANLVISETSGITGSGTLNTIAMFTPNGQAIGDSWLTQERIPGIAINYLNFEGPSGFQNKLRLINGYIETTDLEVTNITAGDTGNIDFQGNTTLGNSTSDFIWHRGTTYLTGPVLDTSNTAGTTGQVLVSNASSQLEWDDATDVVSGAITKLVPFQVTASAGGSSTYSANNNIVEIGWTGGNGTYVLNIPSATTIPYRNIRFVTNSTFPSGASDKVQITAQSGETIDGAAFFEISKQYEGVSIWSNGTEWIVIQAKAH